MFSSFAYFLVLFVILAYFELLPTKINKTSKFLKKDIIIRGQESKKVKKKRAKAF